jgi:hypothetical protein
MTWKVIHASKFHPIKTYFNISKQVARHLKEEKLGKSTMDRNHNSIKLQIVDHNAASKVTSMSIVSDALICPFLLLQNQS